MSAAPKRLLLVLAGLLVPLALAELALRASSTLYRGAMLRSRAARIDASATRILCIGDSNTFGVRVAADDSYPGQLMRLLNGGARDGRHYQVVNAGVPGQNTAQMKNALPELLDEVQPSIVLALGGLNNTWNVATELDAAPSLLDSFRLVRLVRIALRDARVKAQEQEERALAGAPEIAATQRLDPAHARRADELRSITRGDLEAIAVLVRDHGAAAVLMTYPGQHPDTRPFNDAAREAARAAGALLVDHDETFRAYVERYGKAPLLFEDTHPAEAGYQLMARDVAIALAGKSLVDLAIPDDRWEPTRFRVEATLAVGHDERGRPAWLDLRAEPDAEFQVYLSPVREPQLDLGTRKVPVGVHPWLEFCRQHAPFHGALDAGGRARVELPDRVRDLKPGTQLYCAFVTSDPRAAHDLAIRSISAAVVVARE